MGKLRNEFETLVYDDEDFKAQWGSNKKKGYTEGSFKEWVNLYY